MSIQPSAAEPYPAQQRQQGTAGNMCTTRYHRAHLDLTACPYEMSIFSNVLTSLENPVCSLSDQDVAMSDIVLVQHDQR